MKYAAALLVTFGLVSGVFSTGETGSIQIADHTSGNGHAEILDLPYEV